MKNIASLSTIALLLICGFKSTKQITINNKQQDHSPKECIILNKAPLPYKAKPIPADKKNQEPFSLKKHQFYKELLQKELNRTNTTDPQIQAYIDRYCFEIHSPNRITFDDGMYPATDRNIFRELVKEGEELIGNGVTCPVVYYCYYDTVIRSGYDLYTYHFSTRKKIALGGIKACQADPKTHPLLTYTFCNEMRMRSKQDEKQQWTDRTHDLLPKVFYPESIGSELTDVSADLLYQLLRWAQSPKECRIGADKLLNDPNVPEWIGLYADGNILFRTAWDKRGRGYANTVTGEGWEGFRDYATKARAAWTKAWELRPDLSEAPSKMIKVALADPSEPNEARKWLDRALSARPDNRNAYDNYSWVVMERWCGSRDKMSTFALECAETDRYDTCIPFLATTVLYQSYYDQHYPDMCPDSENYIPIFEKLFEGYRNAEYLKGEDRNAVMSWIAALAIDAKAYKLGHQILKDINYQYDRRYFRKQAGLYFEDYIWMAWCNGGPEADLITQAQQNATDGQYKKAIALYGQVLERPDVPPKAFDRILMEKALINFRQSFNSGDWVNVYSGNSAPEWVNSHTHWSRSEDGWLKSDTKHPAEWLPVEVSLTEGFELELDVGGMKSRASYETYIYLSNPGWHDLNRPYIKLSAKRKNMTVYLGINKAKTAGFNPTGNDRLRIEVKDKKISVMINGKTIVEQLPIPEQSRFEKKIGLALGDHSRGKHNQKNRYNNIRIKKGSA